ncbi:MAG: hypothetical protein WCP59_11260 [Actinomycetota bacterium]
MSRSTPPRRRTDRHRPGDIEFLTPDPAVFGPSASTLGTTDDGTPSPMPDGNDRTSSRRATIAAVGLVTAIVIGAVVVAAPWRDDSTATVDTTATTTTVPVPLVPDGVVTGDEPVRGVVLDPPPGWQVAGALSSPPFGNFEGWGEVWAQAGSTRERGAWYALSITPFGLDGIGVADAVRVRVDTRTALVERADDGALTLTVEAPFERLDRLVRIEARGTTVDELARFAASIGIDDDRPQLVDDRFVYRDPAFLEPMTEVWSGPTDWDPIRTAVVDDVVAYTLYTDGDGGWLWLGLHDTEGPLPMVAMLEFEQQLVADVGPPGATNVLIGRSPSRSHTWLSFDDRWVSAISTLDEDELVAVLPSLRWASDTEWALARRAEGGAADPGPGAVPQIPIATGTLDDGTTWAVEAEPLGIGTAADLCVGPGATSPCSTVDLFADADDPLGIVSTLDLTLVVSRSPGPHTLRITTAAGAIDQTIEQAVDGPTAVPVLAFGDLRVELLGPAGQVVDTQ